jgi:hypothetical protein
MIPEQLERNMTMPSRATLAALGAFLWLLILAPGPAATTTQGDRVVTQRPATAVSLDATVERRQREALRMLAKIAPPTEKPWRSALSRHAASILLGTHVDEAIAWFSDPATHEHKTDSEFEWGSLQMLRAYHALKANEHFVDTGCESRVKEFLLQSYLPRVRDPETWGGRYLRPTAWAGSENHVIVQFSIRLLLEELAGDGMDREAHDTVAAQIRQWCWEKAVRGLTEFSSPHYTERSLLPLLNVCDYAADASLRECARMAVDQMMAEYAVIQINGFRGGAMRRFYQYGGEFPCAEISDGRDDCLYPVGQILLGGLSDDDTLAYPTSGQKLGHLFYATTSYRPSPVHLAVAGAARVTPSVFRSARRWEHEYAEAEAPDTYIYAYRTPHYVLGSIRIPPEAIWGRKDADAPAYHGTTNRGIPFRLSFRRPRAMIGAACALGGSQSAGHDWALDPPDARALFQHENVLLYKGRVDTYRSLEPAMSAEESVASEERDGDLRFFHEPGADGETVYVGVCERNGLGIMEVRLASEHPSWASFKQAFTANAPSLESETRMDHRTIDGRQIEYRGPDSVTMNAEPQQMSGLPLYRSPLISAPWFGQGDEAGRIVIGNEQTGRLVLDFSNPDDPRRTEQSPVRLMDNPR